MKGDVQLFHDEHEGHLSQYTRNVTNLAAAVLELVTSATLFCKC